MKWIKRIDDVYIKFREISKKAYLGAKIEYIKNYTFLATIYITNENQSQLIKIADNSFSTLSGAKQYCDKCLKTICENIWEMYEG